MRFYNVSQIDGTSVDLVVTPYANGFGNYTAKDASVNGMEGCFGVINVATKVEEDTSVRFNFKWVKAGKSEAVAVPDFFFTVFDEEIKCAEPTPEPTPEPTAAPTALPTPAPTAFPTPAPTPGSTPSPKPIKIPNTPAPTLYPTPEVTYYPTYGEMTDEPTAEPTDEPTTFTTTCGPIGSCEIYADPHVSGFDNLVDEGPANLHHALSMVDIKTGNNVKTHLGVRARTFDRAPVDVNAYERGDFWLVKSQPIYVQGRFRFSREFVPDRAAVGAIAIGGPFLRGSVLVVEALDGDIRFGGEVVMPGHANFTFSRPGMLLSQHTNLVADGGARTHIEAKLPEGMTVRVARFPRHVDVKISMPPVQTGMDGECGNYNGDDEDDKSEFLAERNDGNLLVEDKYLLFRKLVPATIAFDSHVGHTYTSASTVYTKSGSAEEGWSFTSDQPAATPIKPQFPSTLSPLQKDRAVTVEFKTRAVWDITYSIPPGCTCGRNFYFGGKSNLVPLPTPAPTAAPTAMPTAAPTAVPTALPTAAPTASPTFGMPELPPLPEAPMNEQTNSPTAEPTAVTTTMPPKMTTTVNGAEKCATDEFGECIIWGDPHILTFDVERKRKMEHPVQEAFFRTRNWKADQLSVYDEGTFWLVNSSNIKIQARYWKNVTNPEFTNLGALSIGGSFLGNNTLVFRDTHGRIMWNNEEILKTYPSSFNNDLVKIKYHSKAEMVKDGGHGRGIDIQLPGSVSLVVNRWARNLALKIRMPRQEGGQNGQCGNFNCYAADDHEEYALLERLKEQDFMNFQGKPTKKMMEP